MASDYVNSGQERQDQESAADTNKRVKALEGSEIIRPGEGMGLAGRIKAMKAAKPTPTPTATPLAPKPFKITSPMDTDVTKVK